MEHLKDCDFKERIKELQQGSWRDGDGEISGYVDIEESRISFSDGWNSFPDIEFKYCPICGVLLSNAT